jgi:hypothetical protein
VPRINIALFEQFIDMNVEIVIALPAVAMKENTNLVITFGIIDHISNHCIQVLVPGTIPMFKVCTILFIIHCQCIWKNLGVDEGVRYANARVDLDRISCGGGIGHVHVVLYNTHADPRCHDFSAIEKSG